LAELVIRNGPSAGRFREVSLYRKLVFTFKVLRQMTPEYLNVFTFLSLKSALKQQEVVKMVFYFLPNFRTEYFKRFF
jgi:hypothetical protein